MSHQQNQTKVINGLRYLSMERDDTLCILYTYTYTFVDITCIGFMLSVIVFGLNKNDL